MSQYSLSQCGRQRGRFKGACKRKSLAGDIGCFWHIGVPKYDDTGELRRVTEDVQDNNEGRAQMSKWGSFWRPVHSTLEKGERTKWQKD